MTVIWNQCGVAVGEQLRLALPGIPVHDIPARPQRSPAASADVLLAVPLNEVARNELGGIDASWAAPISWIHSLSTGVDQYPPQLLEGRRLTCTRGVWSIPISEYVMAAILAFQKQMPAIFSGEPVAPFSLGLLNGSTLGLVGFGSIGQDVARRALAFGMRVVAVRRTARPCEMDGVELTSLKQVITAADHLVLALPGTSQTAGLIDAAALAQVKAGVHIVNVGRGIVLDHDALLQALVAGRVGGATLDVTEPDPLVADHPLRAFPGVQISPHIASATADILDRGIDYFVENVRRYRAGEPLLGEVDLGAGY